MFIRVSQINFDKNRPAQDKRADFNKHFAQLIGN